MTLPKPFFRWRPHPWHGLEAGPDAPAVVNAYIELTPFDTVKYEIDKETGYLRVDRPQRTSSQPPMLYGFIPRTFCGQRVGALLPEAARGDEDPLDVCVISERPIQRSEVVLQARVLGGLPMVDDDEADDKIIAVLDADEYWSSVVDVEDLPDVMIQRLRHYFLTYKTLPGEEDKVSIGAAYGRAHALEVIRAAMADYEEEYGT